MPTISDSDSKDAIELLRKFMDTTSDRKSWMAVKDLLARIEGAQPALPDPLAGVYAVFNSWTRPGP